MKAEDGAPRKRATGTGTACRHAWHGLRQRAVTVARHAAPVLAREPVAGFVGAAFIVTAAPVLAYLLARPAAVPDHAWLCQETGAVLAAGALLFSAARLRLWER
jgi:hypothetical protein